METGVHDVATLLKEFFRDLPEPVIPKEVQSALLASQSKLEVWLKFSVISKYLIKRFVQ